MRMAATVAHGVPAKLDWCFTSIANEFPLLFKEDMLSMRCEKDKESPVPEVLNVCKPGGFAPGPRRLSDAQPVFRDQLLIDRARIFPFRNFADDVKEVP